MYLHGSKTRLNYNEKNYKKIDDHSCSELQVFSRAGRPLFGNKYKNLSLMNSMCLSLNICARKL